METVEVFDAKATAQFLDFGALVQALRQATLEHAAGLIHAPVRIGVPLQDGGVFLSMPASAADVAIHKLVSVSPANVAKKLPTIFGTVTVCDGATGQPEFILDGPTVTGRRTAALSMLGVRLLHPRTPSSFLLVGTGQQAQFHAAAIGQLHPEALLYVRGQHVEAERAFCASMRLAGVAVMSAREKNPADIDTVITVTTSKTPVYTEAAQPGRLVIGVGAFTPDAAEIAPATVEASAVFVDDLDATREEAGDLLQAAVDWSTVRSLASACEAPAPKDKPILLKTVGSGAWDLAACRVARSAIRNR
ncbi:bifunctional Delta(1)-pyrroline-2-carboxylate/Delta(1)-piperideine-2-carboxylate reductase [Paraburkholderia kururiensis]|uniref:Bifunctional Delta(1)-pyrroline-2-carboxylate/Delta(1)-piperideine-2-carboxylate reductase n=1 Tax=Paraburkholderia kururiensis TaxID=984307 RepID=A0ABZ0WT43_9BURK|nr:bifunctional Delta(1)-pyrroline-2-carboxylate/Delta(1)-piperideine-2-carboxylate reductase [Paraburkholderia kururiensis]WQD80419.1 bifunctional Delta(1)-pyrroline-2-carboxylate/Delta(1)-piperideine-2-carboxylate reductase [Paraburkholderia kururiensis]